MFDDIKNMAGDVLGNATGASGMIGTIVNMTDLDEKAIAALEAEFGKEKVDSIKEAIQDGKVDANEIGRVAEEFGVPETVVQMMLKFYQAK